MRCNGLFSSGLASGLALALAAASLAACGAEYAGSDSAQGGNVGFGGAQDIGQFRNILAAGEIPGENTLDANGFFAEHFAELPPPDCGDVLCLHGMLAVGQGWVSHEYQAVLQVAMNTPVDPQLLERPPLDLVVVVDTSGSMAEDDRIGYVRQGLHLLIDELDEGDRLALVTYSSDVAVRAGLGEVADKAQLHTLVDGLVASGSTNLYAGLQQGLMLAAASFDIERQNRVILLSDGMPTVGTTDSTSIMDMADDYVREGVGLTTIGVGLDFNVDLMRGLAEADAGNFYFVEDADAVQEVFVGELDYFVTPLALDIELQVVPGSGYRAGEVLGTRFADGNAERVWVSIPAVFVASRVNDAPDGGGRRGGGSSLFVRMDPIAGMVEPGTVAEVRMRYRLPGTDTLVEQEIMVSSTLAPGTAPEDVYVTHEAMKERYAMYNLYLGLRSATQLAAYSYDCALVTLQKLDESAETWNRLAEDPDIAADRALIAQFMDNLVEHGARTGQDAASCADGVPDDYYYDDVEYHRGPFGCSAAGPGSGPGTGAAMMALLLACRLVTRRRKPLA